MRRQLLVFRWQGHAELLLNFLTVRKANVLGNVGHHGALDHRCLGVLANQLHDDRVLHRGHVYLDVGLVVLVQERFDRLALEHHHVFGHRVFGLLVVWQRHELVGVLDAQHLQHIAVQQRQVVNLGGHLRHLDDGLVLHHALAHGCRVGVRHRDDVYVAVVFCFGSAPATVWLVVVRWVCVVADEPGQQVQLLFERVVHTRLHSRHHFELALQQSQSCAHRGVGRHVGDLHIRSSCEAATFFNDSAQQLEQDRRRLFVWQWQDVVSQCA